MERRLAYRLLFNIIIFSSLITMIITAFQLYLEYKRDISLIEQQIKQIQHTNLKSLSKSLWYLHYDQIQLQLEGILELSDIEYLEITMESGSHFSLGAQKENQRKLHKHFSIDYEVGKMGKVSLGTLHITANLERVYQDLRKRLIVILGTQAIKTFFVSFFILFIVNYLITRHLSTLSIYTRKLDLNHLDNYLNLDRKVNPKKPDELEHVVSAINDMRTTLIKDFAEKERIKKQLQKAHDTMEVKVEERTAELVTRNEELKLEIKERMRIEEALQESEAQKKAILNGITTNLAFVNENLEIQWVNKTSANSVNKSPEEMVGYKCHKFWADPEKPCDNCPTEKAFRTRKTEQSIMHAPDGKIWDEKGEPVFNENGELIGVVEIAIDITEKTILENQIQQLKKMEAIGTLAGGIAHDFNNMLAVIFGNISYLLNRFNENEELVDVLSDIQEGGKKAQNLTHQLLTFSKGGAPIKKATDLNSLIKESAIFVTRGSKSKCEYDFSDDLWISEVDSGQLNQVISNLIINANQAMPNGGIVIIRTENIEMEIGNNIPLPNGKYIKITIEDQGIGISEKHFANIFDPYFSTKQKGRGLGLATSYSIIKRHGGHISVESKIDEGTTFFIYLLATDKEVKKAEKKESDRYSGHGKILVMDDEEHILKMSGRMLKNLGYEFYSTLDGKQALEMYHEALKSNQPFDLVILDLTIPGGMGGQETIKKLLEIDPNVKTVVSSGYSNDPVMSNFRDYGFKGIIPKPYSQDEVAKVLNEILDEI